MKRHFTLLLRVILLLFFAYHLVTLTEDDLLSMAVTKSLLMPLLLIYYLLRSKDVSKHKTDYLLISALFFSWLGDLALLKGHSETNFFIYGLLAFLAAHIFYSISFYKDLSRTAITSLVVSKPHFALPFAVFSILFIYFLLPGLGDMKAPVMLYTLVITSMLIFALNRWKKVSTKSFYFVMFGTILFFMSDAMIAYNKFYQVFEHERIAIMSTYIFGQWFIVEGILFRKG
ncbi:MAG: lysoplasmalogenase [Chitinophagales bacterium]